MTITYSIENVTDELVKNVLLRKFFQMVFVGDDRKSLHIYTATVLGALDQISFPPSAQESLVSDLGKYSALRLKFEFAIGSNDTNEVVSIINEDITDCKKGFLDEVDCVQKVWGAQCKIIKDSQHELISKLTELVGESDEDESRLTHTAELANRRMLWMEQDKRPQHFYRALAIPGVCDGDVEITKASMRDGIEKRKAYTISVPQDVVLPKGIELVNWVKTSIVFKYRLDENSINYVIKKSDDDVRWLAPDFTWYFSPVIKSVIDNRKCMIELKRKTSAEQSSEGRCPFNPTYLSDKFQNSIDNVPNKLTVNFSHWIDEKINLRQKYRLAAREVLPSIDSFDNVSEINIFLDIHDEHNRGNRQFLYGIFISLILAYGIDSTRLLEIEPSFWFLTKFIPSDILWMIFSVFCALTFIFMPARLDKHSRSKQKFRIILLISTLIWSFAVFCLFRIPVLCNIIPDFAYHVVAIAYLCILALQIVYLFIIRTSSFRTIFHDLFGSGVL